MRRYGLIGACALVAFALAGHGTASQTTPLASSCTAAQKAKAQRALAAYKKRMARDRAAYFRTHTSTPLTFVAVDYLIRAEGMAGLVRLWAAIGGGASWQDAFGTTFGRSVDQFYAEFETYRRTL